MNNKNINLYEIEELYDFGISPDLVLENGGKSVPWTIDTNQEIILEDFETACEWSATNDGRPFTRSTDGEFFTPVLQ